MKGRGGGGGGGKMWGISYEVRGDTSYKGLRGDTSYKGLRGGARYGGTRYEGYLNDFFFQRTRPLKRHTIPGYVNRNVIQYQGIAES